MARESCNLDKDDAEILQRSSATSPSPSPPAPPPSPPALCLQSQQELQAPEMPENLGNTVAVDSGAGTSCKPKPDEEEEHGCPVRFTNRCSSCHKRVGLTGFRCRCGDLFCARHRHSDTHDCSFDYKAAGREQIAKANPLIRAAKLIKI